MTNAEHIEEARLTEAQITSKVMSAMLGAVLTHPRDSVKALTLFVQRINADNLYVEQRGVDTNKTI